jgi:integrase
MHIWCTYRITRRARKQTKLPTRITETVRSAALRRPLVPSVIRDRDVAGFALHVTRKRAFWALSYQPKGVNPATGRRWGGGVRHELGDALLVGVAEARGLALAAKAAVRAGGDPHRAAMASRASAVAERSILPSTVTEILDAYAAALMARRQPSESSRRMYVHYARKAIRLMRAESLALAAIDERMVRLMVETMAGSEAERHMTFHGLARLLAWCRKQGLVEHDVFAAFDRDERPRGGQARDHVPTLDELHAVWNAVEADTQRDLVHFMLLVPLRRNEAAGLAWNEVDLRLRRVRIPSNRAKTREAHELPLSTASVALLEARQANAPHGLVFPSATHMPFAGFNSLIKRIRARIGQSEAAKSERFVLHDIRRAFVSHLAERGHDVDLLDQCLGHSRKGVFGVYQRASRMSERARALEAWAGLVTGEVEQTGKVVPLRASGVA